MAQLYDASSARVFGLALRILRDRNAAEDAVVEVYAQAWRDASRFDVQRGNASAWLMTMARSRAIDILRSRRREPASEPLDAAGEMHSTGPVPRTRVPNCSVGITFVLRSRICIRNNARRSNWRTFPVSAIVKLHRNWGNRWVQSKAESGRASWFCANFLNT